MQQFDKKQIMNSFNRATENYDDHAVLQMTVADRLLSRLELVKINPGWIIDVGSGTGRPSRELARKYRQSAVLQLDLSSNMLHTSRQRQRRFFPRQHYVCGDAEVLPVINSSIDLVFSSLVLQWCNNLDDVFTEFRRVLRNNGLLMFATLGPDTLKELRESWSSVDNLTHVNPFFDMHDIGDALVRSGMESVVMDVETITMTYPDCSSLMHDIKSFGAHNINSDRPRGLTGREKINKLNAHYEQFRKDGVLPATYEIVYGHAWASERLPVKNVGGEVRIPVDSLRKIHH